MRLVLFWRNKILFILFDNIYIRFGINLNLQSVGIPMGTSCVIIVAVPFSNERDLMRCLSLQKPNRCN